MPRLNHILCIDDEPDILEVACMALEAVGGFKITSAKNGIEGIEVAKSISPNLILLDMMMPAMDGRETLRKIREIKELDEVPVVFMTARVQPQEVEEYLALGAAGVIEKPFDPMKLPEQVTSIWEVFFEKRQ